MKLTAYKYILAKERGDEVTAFESLPRNPPSLRGDNGDGNW